MDCFENGEAIRRLNDIYISRLNDIYIGITPSGQLQPFPFLQLPRELRDSIYYYALLRPGHYVNRSPVHICSLDDHVSWKSSDYYWGTEKSTRLFRVNHQVSDEALEVFYSRFPFHFPPWVAKVKRALCPLSASSRSLITSVAMRLFLTTGVHWKVNVKDEEDWRMAVEAMIEMLPNVRRVELTFSQSGQTAPDDQVKDIVDRAVKMAGPLKGFPGLVLRGCTDTTQRARITADIRKALMPS